MKNRVEDDYEQFRSRVGSRSFRCRCRVHLPAKNLPNCRRKIVINDNCRQVRCNRLFERIVMIVDIVCVSDNT